MIVDEVDLGEIFTVCQDCLFCPHHQDPGFSIKSEIGCYLNRDEIYQENGTEIIEAENENGPFNIIKGKICTYHTSTNEWPGWRETAQKIAEIDKKLGAKLYELAFCVWGESEEQLRLILDRISLQDIKPFLCHFFVKAKLADSDFIPKLISLLQYYNLTYRVHKIMEDPDRFQMLNIVGDKKGAAYYAWSNTNQIPPDFSSKLFQRVHHKILPFAYCEGKMNIVSEAAHKSVGGSGEKSVIEKLKERAAEQNRPDLIIKYEDL